MPMFPAEIIWFFAFRFCARYRGDSCGDPYFVKLVIVIYMGSMLILFGIVQKNKKSSEIEQFTAK